ncbi:MAG: chemotaxis protein CheW [Methanobacteriota archaeon]
MTKKAQLQEERKRESINWDNVHRRLGSMENVIEHIRTPEPAKRVQILRNRAKLLSLEEIPDGKEEHFSALEFLLAYEHYAIEITQVKEVLRLRELTLLPGSPPFVLGIINIRGEIFSIIDLKKVLKLPDRGLPEFNTVIVMRDATRKFGFVVDSAIGIRQISHSDLMLPPEMLTGSRIGYVMGVTSQPLIVLDGGKILADRNLIVNE